MSDGLVWEYDPEPLRRPVLVAGFEGWNDAADAASSRGHVAHAARHADDERGSRTIDPEEHFDFQSRRPQVELVDGVTRAVTWPENTFFSRPQPETATSSCCAGIEPSYRWRSFCDAVLDVASVDRVRAGRHVRCAARRRARTPAPPASRVRRPTPSWSNGSGSPPSRYEGPTGIVGVLHDCVPRRRSCRRSRSGRRCPTTSRPRRTRRRRSRSSTGCTRSCGLSLDLGRLERTAAAWREKVDEVAAADEDVQRLRVDARGALRRRRGQLRLRRGARTCRPATSSPARSSSFLREQRGDS